MDLGRRVTTSEQGHGGLAVARALEALGVDHVYGLTGGHIFPILDGCHQAGIDVVDVRHEQTAGFAAEAWARLRRAVGVAVVTAGPGVTNLMTALAQARFNRASVLALAGRAPMFRWGQGSLQEIDHIEFVRPLAHATTVEDTAQVVPAVVDAAQRSMSPPRGPAFLDFPVEVLFNTIAIEVPQIEDAVNGRTSDPSSIEAVAHLIDRSERPVLVAGSNVWMDRAELELRRLAEKNAIPVYMNGQGRGCVPADHELAFARSRTWAFGTADLIVVVGAPLDFRLAFGASFAADAKVVHLESAPELQVHHVELAAAVTDTRLDVTIRALVDLIAERERKEWIEALRVNEAKDEQRSRAGVDLETTPIHPLRIYAELVPRLDRDAVVIGDGGDFVSFAGREIPSFEPGRWLDPGPFGGLGCGPGYAIAARRAYPASQVVLLMGDGALGLAASDLESLVRHRLPVVCIVGNNGIWGLEKHPMAALYGYDIAADLAPGLRYDEMMMSFGGGGELVEAPDDLGPALDRALESDEPYLVNVITDPKVAYPRSSMLL